MEFRGGRGQQVVAGAEGASVVDVAGGGEVHALAGIDGAVVGQAGGGNVGVCRRR